MTTAETGLNAIRARYAAIDEPCGNVAVVIHRMQASAADVPRLIAAWEALKEDLAQRINSDLAIAGSFGPDHAAGQIHNALVSANRSTLAKMWELEAGS